MVECIDPDLLCQKTIKKKYHNKNPVKLKVSVIHKRVIRTEKVNIREEREEDLKKLKGPQKPEKVQGANVMKANVHRNRKFVRNTTLRKQMQK